MADEIRDALKALLGSLDNCGDCGAAATRLHRREPYDDCPMFYCDEHSQSFDPKEYSYPEDFEVEDVEHAAAVRDAKALLARVETDTEVFARLARSMIEVFDRGKVDEATANELREVLSDKEKRRGLILLRYQMDARFRALVVAVATAIEHNGMTADDARDVGFAVALGLGKS